jgi:hypothetical protein
MSQTLYLHIGGGKTGSSAIQNYLELNADELGKYGIAYYNKINISSPYEITSGNGIPLVSALLSGNESSDIETLIKSYIGHQEKGICSSEMFSELKKEHFEAIIRCANKIDVNIQIIIYVRDVIPYLLSAYDQRIKRHGECRPFNKWVSSFYYKHFVTLNEISTLFDKKSISIIHYETSATDLIGSFFGALGVNMLISQNGGDSTIVNRSLCRDERSAIRAINRITGGLYSTEISDMLISINPNTTSDKMALDCGTVNYLQTRFQDQVSWMNKYFFDGKSIVSIQQNATNKTQPTKRNQQNVSCRKLIHDAIFEWCNNEKQIIDAIRLFCEENKANYIHNKHLLPDDFDCINYLAINRDVFFAKNDPSDHYIRNGIAEGRQYKTNK